MPQQFDAVHEDDFSKIGGERPSFLKIEDALVQLGGTGIEGVKFKNEALKAAGWKYHELVSYGKFPAVAAEAFNSVRLALEKTDEARQLKTLLSGEPA